MARTPTAPSTSKRPARKSPPSRKRAPKVRVRTAVAVCSCGHPPLYQTPPPTSVKGAWFDQAAVDRVQRALRGLRHTKGRWARRPLELEPYQLEHIVAPVFGWKDPTGLRIVRTVWIEVPRKNGKSTLSSGLGIVLLVADGELGAEVYAAAASKPQAKIVHTAAKEMARTAPALRGKLRLLADVITVPRTGGVFRALSSLADVAHGLNVSGAVIDEIHVHKNRELIDAIESGEGSREQPLIIFITTADEGDEFSIYAEKHNYTIQCAKGIVDDPSHFGVIWAAEETDDPFADETLKKANPGVGSSLTMAYLRNKAKKAQTNPGYLPTYRRLHLNIRERSQTAWLDLKRWDATAGLVKPEDFAGKIGYGGLDLSSTTDLTAWLLQVPDGEGWLVRPLFWLPEERVEELEDRCSVPFTRWARDGFLRLTEGNVVDYAQVRGDIKAEITLLGCKVAEVGYDAWNAAETVQELERDKFVMIPINQSYAGLTGACKEIERLVAGSTKTRPLYQHGGHPVLRWMADCVEVSQDQNGNIKPAKPNRKQSAKRIDGMSAAANAMARAVLRKPPKTSRAAGF